MDDVYDDEARFLFEESQADDLFDGVGWGDPEDEAPLPGWGERNLDSAHREATEIAHGMKDYVNIPF